MPKKRKQKIDAIIGFLEEQKKDSENLYAVEENLRFFQSVYTLPGLLKWYFRDFRKIDSRKILELGDFDSGDFDLELQKKLISLERRKVPGLISPLVKRVSEYVKGLKGNIFIADLGSGSMELSRQILAACISRNIESRLVIIGFEYSPEANKIAFENLKSQDNTRTIHIKRTDKLLLEEMLNDNNEDHLCILYEGDMFQGMSDLNVTFDIIYHSFFKHHLSEEEKKKLDEMLNTKAKKIFEYDGFQTKLGSLIQCLYSYNDPVLLNGAALSNVRYHTKKTLQKANKNGTISFYTFGSYLSYLGTYLKEQ